MTGGPLQQRSSELVTEVLDRRLGKLVKVIDQNTTKLSQALKQFKRLTGVTATNYLWMTKLLNWLGEPKLVRDKGKARAVEDENESDQKDEDEDETGK